MSQPNPFQDSLRFERRAPACAVVIFGANGDLTKRKLLPALYRLAYEQRIPPAFAIVGISRTPMTDDAFREKMRESVQEFLENSEFDPELWKTFAQGLFYVAGDLHDPATYDALKRDWMKSNRRGTPKATCSSICRRNPASMGPRRSAWASPVLANGNGWRRIIIEKPIGHDLASAQELNRTVQTVFPESAIYRIDHYLGKETVQNIMAFRFSNGIFEPLWNRRYVSHVQITAAESIGVEGRGAYYQEAGALRDMIQNHLLQVMALTAMEPPAMFTPDAVRDERAKVLQSIRIWKPEEVACNAVAGQYGPRASAVSEVPGFRQEEGVDPNSQTATYAAADLLHG